ncbi:MAG: MFS transporter [Sedimenticola sp.]
MFERKFFYLAISNALASVGTGVSMIALPWLIVSQYGVGDNTIYLLAGIVNLVLFLIVPFVGPIIDNSNRKYLMIIIRISFSLVVLLGLTFNGEIFNVPLTILIYYFAGSLFYVVNIPTRTAFIKDLYRPSEYSRINSFLEAENQIAAVVTGVVAILLIERVSISQLALINVLLYMLAIVLISLIPYTTPHLHSEKQSGVQLLSSGLEIVRYKSDQFALIAVGSLPYVVVIGFTIFHPAAIATFENANSQTYALVETLFGLGAIVAGVSAATLTDRIVDRAKFQLFLMSSFALVCFAHVVFVNSFAFIILAFLLGFLNSTIRIVRTTQQMTLFSQNEIGRVGAFLQSWILGCRVLLIGCLAIFSKILSVQHLAGILTMVSVLALASLMYLNNKNYGEYQ